MLFDQLKRREFITLLGVAAAAWPLAARAQQGERTRRASPGYLRRASDGLAGAHPADRVDSSFVEGLAVQPTGGPFCYAKRP
jgi:hypothetical protein